MLKIQTNVQLKALNTLSLDAVASHYVQINQSQELLEAIDFAEQNQLNIMILSGGSNMLLPNQINALVIHMNIQGNECIAEDDKTYTLRVGAGQNWHEFVLWTTEKKMYGLQNLALIPGLVGASPVQNIGAYGVEVGEFIHAVEVYNRVERKFESILAEDCDFSYRHSIFKDNPTRYIIINVVFKLLKNPDLKIQYGDLKVAMANDLSPENLQNQVIQIRRSKLPDPKEFPNAGSFFKNPVIQDAEYEKLALKFPNVPHYPQSNHMQKIAAGWLIEQVGWKGKQLGNVGMFSKQALVLVNYADANLQDVQTTYRAVQQDVLKKFGIQLEPEPVLFDSMGFIQPHSNN